MSEYAPRRRKAADPLPLAPPDDPAPPTCAGCRHWHRPPAAPGGLGLCVAAPPGIQLRVTDLGPLCVYPVTESTTPACGRHTPV